MGLSGTLYRQLQKISGKQNCTREKEDLLCYAYDSTGTCFLPDAVIFPGSEKEVSRILKFASKERLIVVPRGTGSGMTGGAVPVKGGLVLVTTRMNKIFDVDENNLIVRVQPGVIVADIHKIAEQKGLFYPPDPSSSSVCTIGGNIGECAGGPKAVKYGVTRDYVLGLRAVLPSGEVIQTGVSTAKGVAGYDLTRLIVGSEGTLAVVTEITLKLLPKPDAVKTMAVFFDSMQMAAKTVSNIMREAVVPRCVEYLDEACLHLVQESLSFELPRGIKALLIIELDGDMADVEKDAKKIKELCLSYGAMEVMVAKDQTEAQKLWDARKALSPVLYKIATNKINEDIVVPIDKIPEMVQVTQDLQKKFGLKVVSFGHAGDGNIHCNIMYHKADKDESKRAQKAVDELFEATLNLGGTITGEHGVGITKIKYLPMEIGTTQIELMKGIKKVFDPQNILNPGKIFC
ncbi:FAD-binding oxidoreductase [Desulfobacula toluolica]|uniref:GlcD: glycolate oxidase, subunit n=1 Tax=Desulfobacula toluolica (strain DSM 7467 / Tol2) TaxID=651182 RepID=K0N926_DESTT|nr:FAD-linked oxidase C-terminal domain-containing protein [Desulfobacula toluolica]CCK80449.1 GlcD: glycolate oxidase, subunit [Desulfobacula toluolica Tol2]